MTTLNYLEFDSTYRNRILWPMASNFGINISQSGNRDRFQAVDPISNSAAKVIFTGSFRNDVASSTIAVTNIDTTLYSANGQFIIETAVGELRTEENFYVGSIIELGNGNSRRRIIKYKFLDRSAIDRASVVVFPDYADIVLITGGGFIYNPTDTSLSIDPLLFIPNSVQIDNYYKRCIVYNVNANETRTVTKYIADIAEAVLDSPAPGWTGSDTYILRHELPCNSGVVGISTTTMISLDPATSSDVDDFYVGGFIRIGLIPAALVPPFDSLPAPWNEVRRIVDYDGATRMATVQPPFSIAPGAPNNTYDIECFSRDNVVPFNYNGSLVSQQQSVCYEIEMINVILPNKLLCSGVGGLPVFYPYLYVGLEAISSSTMNSSTSIYSNNPNSVRKLFRVLVDDTQTPFISPFIKLDGDGMTQTIKFKPNDNFQFTVCHAGGGFFKTVEEEYFGPSVPNPLIQISALFSIRRVD